MEKESGKYGVQTTCKGMSIWGAQHKKGLIGEQELQPYAPPGSEKTNLQGLIWRKTKEHYNGGHFGIMCIWVPGYKAMLC